MHQTTQQLKIERKTIINTRRKCLCHVVVSGFNPSYSNTCLRIEQLLEAKFSKTTNCFMGFTGPLDPQSREHTVVSKRLW